MNNLNFEFEIRNDMLSDEYEYIKNNAIYKMIQDYLKPSIHSDDIFDKNIAFKIIHQRYKIRETEMYEKISLIPIDIATIKYEPTINLYNSKKYTIKERIKILFKGRL